MIWQTQRDMTEHIQSNGHLFVYDPHPHKSHKEPNKLRLRLGIARFEAEPLSHPTLPFPKSSENPNKSIELPPPRLRFAASLLLKLLRLNTCCNALCAPIALSISSCWSTNNTATRAKSRTCSVMMNCPFGFEEAREEAALLVADGVASEEY